MQQLKYIIRETIQDRHGWNTCDVQINNRRLIFDTRLEAERSAVEMQKDVDKAYTKYRVDPIWN